MSPRTRTELTYIAVALALFGIGAWFFAKALEYGADNVRGIVTMQVLGAIPIGLAVGLFLYRVLNQTNLADWQKFTGSGLSAVGMFGLVFYLQSLALKGVGEQHELEKKITPARDESRPAATNGPIKLTATLDQLERLKREDFDTGVIRLHVIIPRPNATLQGEIDEAGMVAFPAHTLDDISDQLEAQVRPRTLREMPRSEFRTYTADLCLQRKEASWAKVGDVRLTCALGGVCQPSSRARGVTACSPETAQSPLARLVLAAIAPPANAQPAPEPDGWVVPDLGGACIASHKLKETFYRFEAGSAAPAGAASFSYAIRVNGKPIFIDGDLDHARRVPVASGRAALAFALQNVEFSGANDGREDIGLTLRFYDRAGKAVGQPATSTYRFTALRRPPDQAGAVTWRGDYVLGREKDGIQLFVHSADRPEQSVRDSKRMFDGFGLVYVKDGRRYPVVGIIRPALGDGVPGVGLALRQPDGRLQFTFSKAEVTELTGWYRAQQAAKPRLRGWFAALQQRPLKGDDAVTATSVCSATT